MDIKKQSSARGTAGVSFAARLSFQNISHSYASGAQTLRDVSLCAEPGEVLCLLGPSGSGKTTLLRIAAGIEAQRSGQVFLNEREIAGPDVFLPPEKRSIGLVFQDFALFPHLTILDNVRFGLTALSGEEARREATIALERVGLEGYANAYPHVLSGGEQQRVALARAMAPRPSVLLMDEPFSGLDSRLKDSVRAETLAILQAKPCHGESWSRMTLKRQCGMGDRIALLKGWPSLCRRVRRKSSMKSQLDLCRCGRVLSPRLNESCRRRRKGGISRDAAGHALPRPGQKDGADANVAIRLSGFRCQTKSGGSRCRRVCVSRRFLGVVELLELADSGRR